MYHLRASFLHKVKRNKGNIRSRISLQFRVMYSFYSARTFYYALQVSRYITNPQED